MNGAVFGRIAGDSAARAARGANTWSTAVLSRCLAPNEGLGTGTSRPRNVRWLEIVAEEPQSQCSPGLLIGKVLPHASLSTPSNIWSGEISPAARRCINSASGGLQPGLEPPPLWEAQHNGGVSKHIPIANDCRGLTLLGCNHGSAVFVPLFAISWPRLVLIAGLVFSDEPEIPRNHKVATVGEFKRSSVLALDMNST